MSSRSCTAGQHIYLLGQLQQVVAGGQPARDRIFLALLRGDSLHRGNRRLPATALGRELLMVFATGALIPFEIHHLWRRAGHGRSDHPGGELFYCRLPLFRAPPGEGAENLVGRELRWPQFVRRETPKRASAGRSLPAAARSLAPRTDDARDDLATAALRGVCAGFVERVDFRQVAVDLARVPFFEKHSANDRENFRSPAREAGR